MTAGQLCHGWLSTLQRALIRILVGIEPEEVISGLYAIFLQNSPVIWVSLHPSALTIT